MKPSSSSAAKKGEEPVIGKPTKAKVGKKKKADETGKPKKALSAYFIWLKDNRAKFTVGGERASETVKRASVAWKGLSADEKKPWEEMAAQDKQRYEEEMKKFREK